MQKKSVELVSIPESFIIRNNKDVSINFMRLPGWEKNNEFMEKYFEKLPVDIQTYIFKFIKHWKRPTKPKFSNYEMVLFVKFYKPHQYVRIMDYMIHVMKVLSYHEWDYEREVWIYSCQDKKKIVKVSESYLWKLGGLSRDISDSFHMVV